jgi:hypothetical protein
VWAALGLLSILGVGYAIYVYWGDAVPVPAGIQSDTDVPKPEKTTTKQDVILGRDKMRGKVVGKITDNKYL